MQQPVLVDRVLPWVLRVCWIAVLVLGGEAIDAATSTSSDAVQQTARLGGALVWLGGVAAMAVPAVITLTATRVIVPIGVVAAVGALAGGAGVSSGVAFLGVAIMTSLLVYSGETGRVFVQASAYGEEDRYPLRPPVAYAVATVVTWLIWAGSLVIGPLALAAQRWVLGGVLTALAAFGAVWLWPRWHRLARRWLVIVPIGVVIHDHVVLAETVMLRRPEINRLRLAPVDTEAADFTGPASGHAIEISTTAPVTAIYAARPSQPGGTVIHMTACLVSPSRPGRALDSARQRRIRVG